MNRHASGDFKGISIPDSSKLIAAEWKALSEDEKTVCLFLTVWSAASFLLIFCVQKYNNLHDQDTKRYAEEYKDTYGHAPLFLNGNGRAEAVAASA